MHSKGGLEFWTKESLNHPKRNFELLTSTIGNMFWSNGIFEEFEQSL